MPGARWFPQARLNFAENLLQRRDDATAIVFWGEAVVPGVQLRTGHLNHIESGRHTTTHTELLPLPGGGHVLDTPGVRNFHLFCTGSQELQFLFPEIAARLPQCEYRSCLHDQEQHCAVRAAADSGEIAESRYGSYRTMLQDALAAERPTKARTPRGRGRWRHGKY
jgi:putative ribosome biogenesis GTPase RsgA